MPHWSEAYSVQYFLIIASDELFLLFRPVEFNPRSPCGERPEMLSFHGKFDLFQSTLPVWGATFGSLLLKTLPKFQSTLPVWGAT